MDYPVGAPGNLVVTNPSPPLLLQHFSTSRYNTYFSAFGAEWRRQDQSPFDSGLLRGVAEIDC
jgi:hypothetical protein